MSTYPSLSDMGNTFDFDGSLRDIYVFRTTPTDWQKLLEFIALPRYQISWSGPFNFKTPPNILEILDHSKTYENIHLSINLLPNFTIMCHFFSIDEIELDLDPRQISNENTFSALKAFMQQVGEMLQKDVLLTDENLNSSPYLAFHAKTRVFERNG